MQWLVVVYCKNCNRITWYQSEVIPFNIERMQPSSVRRVVGRVNRTDYYATGKSVARVTERATSASVRVRITFNEASAVLDFVL